MSACGVLLFGAVLSNMALLLTIEAVTLGVQFLFLLVVCNVDFYQADVHHVWVFSGFKAPATLLSAKHLTPVLMPVTFKTKGTFDFGPQLVLVACGLLPFYHSDGSWLDLFEYCAVELGFQSFAEQDGCSLGIWLPASFEAKVVELSNVHIEFITFHFEGH
jgi:hypothetical protein